MMDYRLVKLILIDSYSPGRVVEFPVEGGAVLTGRNGRGKTTLLQLIPIFYGENPARIVGIETNRLDFNAFYLPRITSYIIFEYQRRDVHALVILHAGREGGERRYRFARTAYRPDLFLLPDGCNILQAPDLQKHFKLHGVIHSAAIANVTEYRSIIQGRTGSGKSWQERRRLVADYACVGSGQHLTHIEKIVSGMFLRRTDFQDLQRMVVSCIAEGEAEIALTAERRKIATWPGHYAAYVRVMEESGSLTEILEQEARLSAVEAELGRIHAKVQCLLAHLESAAADNHRQRERQAGEANREAQAHQRMAEGLRIRLQSAAREAEEQQKRVDALTQQQANWLARDVPAQAEQLVREPELRAQLNQLQQRREALLGAKETISLTYERLLGDLERRASQAETAAAEARAILSQQFEPRLQALESQARTERDAMQARHLQARQAVETRLQETLECRGEFSQRVRVPEPDPELVRIHADKAAAGLSLEGERRAAEVQVGQCREALAGAKAGHQAQEQDLERLRHQQRSLEDQQQRLLLQQSPGEDSLLQFLRLNRPDWVFDIAKVIREELLLRSDLTPELIETLPTLYGVGLDLGPVEAHLAADEAGLRREIGEIETQRRVLAEEHERGMKMLEHCEHARREADQALTLANSALQRAITRLGSASEEEKAARQRVEHSRKRAAVQAREQLDRLTQEAEACNAELRASDQRHRQALQAADAQRAAERSALEEERRIALARHDQTHQERRGAEGSRRAAIEAEREQKLSDEGVDTATLKRLEKEITDTEAQLLRIDQCRNAVSEWRLWLANDWPRREEHARCSQAAREAVAEAHAELKAEERRWQIRHAEWQGILERLDREHARLQMECDAVRQRLDAFRGFPPDEPILTQPYDAGWTLEALTAQANANQREAADLGRSLARLIEQVKKAFYLERQTPPDDYYESHRAELGPEAPPLAWIPVFKSWFDTEHDDYRRTLAVEAQQIASAIVGFHRDLDVFHRKVQQFNRELQQSLDANLGFDSVSRVTVEVKSVIRELEYWQPITALAEEHGSWLRLGGQDLPPPEFADVLSALLEHWEVREGIRAALPSLIRIQGEVVENGQTRTFHKAADLERVSSNGLSYLILCVIFIAFINRIRRHAQVEVVWALDELKDLDLGNIEALLTILRRNAITLVSAFPDPDTEVLALFRHRFSVEEGRRLLETRVTGWEADPTPAPEPESQPDTPQDPLRASSLSAESSQSTPSDKQVNAGA